MNLRDIYSSKRKRPARRRAKLLVANDDRIAVIRTASRPRARKSEFDQIAFKTGVSACDCRIRRDTVCNSARYGCGIKIADRRTGLSDNPVTASDSRSCNSYGAGRVRRRKD